MCTGEWLDNASRAAVGELADYKRVGPALVGLPATWAATDLAKAGGRWFRRLRHRDGLSRAVQAAIDGDVVL